MYKKTYNGSSKRKYKRRIYKKKKAPANRLPKVNLLPELKSSTTTLSNVGIDNNGYQVLYNGIDQGTSASTRIGNIIKMKSYNAQLQFVLNGPATIKLAIVYDKQPNGTQFALSDYLSTISSLFPPWCQRRQDTRDRFVTLKEKTMDIAPNISGQSITKELNIYGLIKKGVQGIYNGSGSTVGAINKGSLYLYLTASTATGTVTVNGSIKVKFTDD